MVGALTTLVLSACRTDLALARELLPILYSNSGELCSVAPDSPGVTVCASSLGAYDVDSPSWQPNGNRIISELGREGGDHTLWLLLDQGVQLRLGTPIKSISCGLLLGSFEPVV